MAKRHPIKTSDKYNVYVDGACSLQRNRAGIGVYNRDLGIEVFLCIDGVCEKKTNSIAELYAIKHALVLLIDLKLPSYNNYVILSDSLYAVRALTEWICSWKKNNWFKADKKPVMHKDLILEIHEMLCSTNISVKWIPRENNKEADALSKKSILK